MELCEQSAEVCALEDRAAGRQGTGAGVGASRLCPTSDRLCCLPSVCLPGQRSLGPAVVGAFVSMDSEHVFQKAVCSWLLRDAVDIPVLSLEKT